MMKARVAAIETPEPRHVVFKLKEPWPDFLTFYGSATGAGWVVPKKYLEKVGDDGFKKAPIGAGPYKFFSFTPGVEVVLEAFDQYWRKPPAVKRLAMKSIPDGSTRLAAAGHRDGFDAGAFDCDSLMSARPSSTACGKPGSGPICGRSSGPAFSRVTRRRSTKA